MRGKFLRSLTAPGVIGAVGLFSGYTTGYFMGRAKGQQPAEQMYAWHMGKNNLPKGHDWGEEQEKIKRGERGR